MRTAVHLLAAGLLIGGTSMFPPVGAEGGPSPVTEWLALGDSYSSGEGIFADDEEGFQNADDCGRATGETARAWAVVAYDEIFDSAERDGLYFVACTGALADAWAQQAGEAVLRWIEGGPPQVDAVSFSFGGNNIRFADHLQGCIDLDGVWGFLGFSPGCEVTEAHFRRSIDYLVGNRDVAGASPEDYVGDTNLPELYDGVATLVGSGGHVFVVGYPQLVEEVHRWEPWRRAIRVCAHILARDVPMLRWATEHLNQQTHMAVMAADARHPDVTFHFIDIATKVYETGELPAQRHGLCGGEEWLNPLTFDITFSDLRYSRSYHPKQAGYAATGEYLASYIRENVEWPEPDVPLAGTLALCRVPESRADRHFGDISLDVDLNGDGSIDRATLSFPQGDASAVMEIQLNEGGALERVADHTVQLPTSVIPGPPLSIVTGADLTGNGSQEVVFCIAPASNSAFNLSATVFSASGTGQWGVVAAFDSGFAQGSTAGGFSWDSVIEWRDGSLVAEEVERQPDGACTVRQSLVEWTGTRFEPRGTTTGPCASSPDPPVPPAVPDPLTVFEEFGGLWAAGNFDAMAAFATPAVIEEASRWRVDLVSPNCDGPGLFVRLGPGVCELEVAAASGRGLAFEGRYSETGQGVVIQELIFLGDLG